MVQIYLLHVKIIRTVLSIFCNGIKLRISWFGSRQYNDTIHNDFKMS